jgi:hypothetical protein
MQPKPTKYIYWHGGSGSNEKGEVLANVHLLVGYNGATISDFQKMAAELRKTFPQAKDSEISCGKVFKSSHVDSHTIIVWRGYIPRGKYRGWIQHENARCEYRW